MKPLRPQKYILKLNSTYLDMKGYNISISLNEAMRNPEMVISIGHSQLIKWIEDLTHTANNYIEAKKIRSEIKYLKKLGNTSENKKNISEKYNKLYELQFEPNLVSIQFDKKSHFDLCCNNLVINGHKFHRLYGTPGGLKMSTVLFINYDLYDDIYNKITNGRNQSIAYTPAKLEAYMALTSSTSNAVSWPRMIVVKGTFTNFISDVIEVRDGINSIDPIVTKVNDKNIELEINDGCGIMTPEYSRKIIFEANGIDEIASGVCARCAYLKGMFFTFPIQEFAETIAKKTTIIDAWGHERNVLDADLIVTTSQLKLWDAYNSYEEYEKNCKQNGYDFRLTKVSEKLDERRNINYQFDQSYYLSDQDIDELISPTIDEIQDIISLDPRKSIVYLAGCGLNEKNFMKSDLVAQALMINKELINDPYIRSRIERMINKKIRLAKISTIDVAGNFALISGDLYAMCEDIFGMKVQGLLRKGEIYHQFWKDKNVSEVVCMRAPMCAHYNIVKQKINMEENVAYWFRYIKDCMILNSWDTLRIAESGCDCDGDIMFTTNNKILVKQHRELPALDCQQRKAPKVVLSMITEKDKQQSEDVIAASNKRSFNNNVGSITNIGTSMLNLQSKFLKGSVEWNELEYRVICIQHYQQLCIDAVKGIKMTPMNKCWNNISECCIKDQDTEEIIKEKEFNKLICANKKPYFFIYRYSSTKASFDSYNKQFEQKLKQKYHLTLKELLESDNLTEELINLKNRYYNGCPVDMSPGTVNRIAWAVNKKFDDFYSIPPVQFNKELIKSGVEYSKADFYAVKEVYLEYQNYLTNFTKRSKQDDSSDSEENIADKSVFDNFYKGKFYEVCPNEYMLCDILIDLLYDKTNSKGVVWEMCGEVIIKNLIAKSGGIIEFPEATENNPEFTCCRKEFVMKKLYIGDEENG